MQPSKFRYTLYLIIAALIAVIFILQCDSRKGVPQPTVEYIRDTVWQVRDTTIYRDKPVLVYEKSQPVPVQYNPDTNCTVLRLQYKNMLDHYFKLRVYRDTLRFDSSYVAVVDSVANNMLVGGTYHLSIKYPEIKETKTITKYAAPRRQIYYGLTGSGNQTGLGAAGVGALYKNRKDWITGLSVKYDFRLKEPVYELSHYRKITFRRK